MITPSLFYPWAKTGWFAAPSVPVNVRITPRPAMCVRQEEIDADRLRELALQLEDLEFERANASAETHEAACKALDSWNMENRDEYKELIGGS